MTRVTTLLAAGLLAAAAAQAQVEAGGQVRVRVDDQTTGRNGTVEAELRGRWRAVTAAATLGHGWSEHAGDTDLSRVNELYVAGDAAGWSFAAGRRIVSWDVGYGFRPNDVVQQERRRTLLPVLLQGKPVLQAERFGADEAWSFVAVDPTSSTKERAFAARAWRRVGSADWHAFARQGEDTGPSLGTAVSWVATDAMEIHASVRYAHEVNGRRDVPQALAGFTWTGENKVSVIGEAWYDGSAPSDAEWADPRSLRGLAGQAATLQNLRRRSVFARIAWTHDGWEPSLDHLWLPADRSHQTTVALGWVGDRVRVDVGLRRLGGPAGSVMAASPVNHIGFAAATWSF
ncbi:MAG: hypothetical protein ABW067_16405 [Rhizobacter sp.]